MNELTVCNTVIHQDEHGRFCLNDLHRAAGGMEADSPNRWTRTDMFQKMVRELTPDLAFAPAEAIRGGSAPGTYVCKELVYSYAMWISATFQVKVVRAYDAMGSKPAAPNPANLSRMQLIQLALQAEEERLALENKVCELEPKARALDTIAAADGMMNVTEAAKALQIRPGKLFDWLSQNKWAYRRVGGSGGWVAYQEKIQSGLLKHKVFTKDQEDGSVKSYPHMLITAKGLAKIAMLMGVQLPPNDLFGEAA